MTISDIKAYMKSKKITQVELAKLTGIPLNTLNCIFSGRTPNPRIDTMQSIEKALGLDTQEPQRLLSPDEQKLVDIIVNLRPEEVKLLSDYVDFIVERRKK